MALDSVQSLALGFNPFVKPKDEDQASSGKARAVGSLQAQASGKKLGLNKEQLEAKKTEGLSFLKEGALGEEDAVYVKGGRAGGLQNLIA